MFSNEEINAAGSVRLKELVENLGYKPKKVGLNEYKIEGYGGLFFNSEKNKWHCFSNSSGGGVIQFLIDVEGKTWKDSVKYLLDNFVTASYDNAVKNYKERSNNKNIDTEEELKGEIELPQKATQFRRLYAYLIKTRKIGKQTVDFFVKRGELYENDKGGMVFIGKAKDGSVKYAMIRGTAENKPFKAEAKNSDKSFGFKVANPRSNKLVVFESAIDLMSYMTLKQEAEEGYILNPDNLLSLGGVGEKALHRMLDENLHIKSIEFALDNDEAGEAARNKFVNKYESNFMLSRLIFRGKDVNEHLIKLVEENAVHKELYEEILNDGYEMG
jgi:hypothetical protein